MASNSAAAAQLLGRVPSAAAVIRVLDVAHHRAARVSAQRVLGQVDARAGASPARTPRPRAPRCRRHEPVRRRRPPLRPSASRRVAICRHPGERNGTGRHRERIVGSRSVTWSVTRIRCERGARFLELLEDARGAFALTQPLGSVDDQHPSQADGGSCGQVRERRVQVGRQADRGAGRSDDGQVHRRLVRAVRAGGIDEPPGHGPCGDALARPRRSEEQQLLGRIGALQGGAQNALRQRLVGNLDHAIRSTAAITRACTWSTGPPAGMIVMRSPNRAASSR